MILIAGILVLGIVAVGLMLIYAGVCWSLYKDVSQQYETAMEREVTEAEETTDLERTVYTPDSPNPPVSTARRLPGACKKCGSPSPSGLCSDCREDSDENTA